MVCHIDYVFDGLLLHYYDFSRRTIADFDKVDTGGEAVVADAAACDVENTDSLAVGTLDDDAAAERVDTDGVSIGVANAQVAVFDIFVCKLAPVAVAQIGVETAAGNDDGVNGGAAQEAVACIQGIGGEEGQNGILQHESPDGMLVEDAESQGVDGGREYHPVQFWPFPECLISDTSQRGGQLQLVEGAGVREEVTYLTNSSGQYIDYEGNVLPDGEAPVIAYQTDGHGGFVTDENGQRVPITNSVNVGDAAQKALADEVLDLFKAYEDSSTTALASDDRSVNVYDLDYTTVMKYDNWVKNVE